MEMREALLRRFVKAFISGALSAATLISIVTPGSWQELQTALSLLLISMVIGGINGVLMAAQKWWSWKE